MSITFNYLFNALDDSHPKSDNIEGLSLELMNHQKTSIYHAQLLEQNEGFRIDWSTQPISYREEEISPYRDVFFNFGILACKVGSGKSFVALGLILKKNLLNFDRTSSDERDPLCFSFKRINTLASTVSTNMILVPHNLFNQWKTYIVSHTNMNVTFVSNKKELEQIYGKMRTYYLKLSQLNEKRKIIQSDDIQETINIIESSLQNIEIDEESVDNLFKEITENKVYLISCNCWNSFARGWKDHIRKKISRIFVDEVHSLHLPNSESIKTNFIWFITSSVNDLYKHRNNGFIHNTISSYRCLSKRYQEYITIKNNDEYVDSSLLLPPPVLRTIICKASIIINLFAGIINNDVKNMLLAEDIDGVVSHLGLEVASEHNIITILCENLEKELDNAKMMYQTKVNMHYASEQGKQEALVKAKEKISGIKEKIESVRQRIIESNMDPILHIEITNPVITSCCKNKFELESLTSYIEFNQSKQSSINCPMCRTPLDLSKLIYIGDKKKPKEKKKTNPKEGRDFKDFNKIENLEYILQNEIPQDKRILIFSEYEGNIAKISETFRKTGRNNLSPLKGSLSHITSLIGKYNSGEIPNLFLNAKYCGSGLNLEKTDVIIMMHKMSDDNIKQVIGRGNRIGRIGVLQVYFLYTDNE